MLQTGSRNPELQHILSYRTQIFMILNNRDEELNVIFKIKVEGEDYTIFATSGRLKCFGCGREGHLARNCPQKLRDQEDKRQKKHRRHGKGQEQCGNEKDTDENETHKEGMKENKRQKINTETQEGRKTETQMETELTALQDEANENTEEATHKADGQNTDECGNTDTVANGGEATSARSKRKMDERKENSNSNVAREEKVEENTKKAQNGNKRARTKNPEQRVPVMMMMMMMDYEHMEHMEKRMAESYSKRGLNFFLKQKINKKMEKVYIADYFQNTRRFIRKKFITKISQELEADDD